MALNVVSKLKGVAQKWLTSFFQRQSDARLEDSRPENNEGEMEEEEENAGGEEEEIDWFPLLIMSGNFLFYLLYYWPMRRL